MSDNLREAPPEQRQAAQAAYDRQSSVLRSLIDEQEREVREKEERVATLSQEVDDKKLQDIEIRIPPVLAANPSSPGAYVQANRRYLNEMLSKRNEIRKRKQMEERFAEKEERLATLVKRQRQTVSDTRSLLAELPNSQ